MQTFRVSCTMGTSDKEVAPRKVEAPRDPAQQEAPVDTKNSTATAPHPSTEERPCACYEGVVYIGHLVEEDGEEVEVVEPVICRRCSR